MAAEIFAPDVARLSSLAGNITSLLESYESAKSPAAKGEALRSLAQASQRLGLAATDPLDAFSDFTFRPLANATVRIALSMGLFPHLSSSKPLSAQELANLTNAEVKLTTRVLRALVAFEFVIESAPGQYLGTPLSAVYTDKSRKAWSIWMWDVIARAATSIGPYYEEHPLAIPSEQTQAVFPWAYNHAGADVFEVVRRIEKLPLLTDAMAGTSQMYTAEALATFPFGELVPGKDEVVIVDVGGARGQTLLEIKNAFPELKGRMISQDLPTTLEGGVVAGVDAELQSYDFFKGEEPVKGAGAYLYQRVFHDWNDESSRLILRNLKPAMGSQSKLIICDVVIPEHQPPARKLVRDMNMFLVGGMERSEKQWEELLESEGFSIVKIHGLQNNLNSVIEARIKGDS